MNGVAEALLLAAVMVLAVPVCVLGAQVLASIPAPADSAEADGERPRIAVLMPAHDESPVIAETVAGVRSQLEAGDRLLVVADNCSDDTASLAERAGAEVVQRFDAERRGKGYALDFGVSALAGEPPGVVVVVDADCRLAPDAVDRIARLCAATTRPVQALYLMHAADRAGVGRRIAEFAWMVKNYVRPMGGLRLGMPCQMVGTGMAFPWSHIRAAKMATGHITEDVLIGINLARAGAPPLFCPQALVTSDFPASEAGERSQRRRWEHGNLALMACEAPGLLLAALARRDPRLAGMALDLAVPPLALLALLIAMLLIAAAVAAASGTTTPLIAAAVLTSVFVATVFLAWARHGRSVISLGQLLCAPLYAVRKIPLYLAFLTKRQVEWVRTRRDG